ncbi:MAG: MMPL family transporter, partial [Gammaproteobacteria bacterium]|nr:MMPL family transporter [Gammaproteobacteria bacterium]
RDIVASVTRADVSNEAFRFGTCRTVEIGSQLVLASRISYVGDLGWELYVPMEQGRRLWEALWDAGQAHGLTACGMGVYGTTGRIEKGYRAYGAELDADYDLDTALIDVREAVDRAKPKLPSTAEEPRVLEQTTDDFPVIQINIMGRDVPERVLYNIALSLRDDIEAIPAVLEAEMNGHREELLEAVIEPSQLETYQISSDYLINTIIRNNRLIAAGALDTGEGRFSVKVPSVIEEASDIFDIPVKTDGETVVTLKDVATIRRTFKDRVSYARVNGNSTISLNVTKRANANVIDTVRQVRAIVEELRPSLPSKVDVTYSQDQAPFAQQQVTELQGNIVTALSLVMVLVVAAMGFRSALLVGMAIPFSFLVSLIILYVIGYTFNFMVMFGMLLGLGMLIDGAIVVVEYADRKMVEGFDRRAAYVLAAKRMFWPVTASIATTLAAFLPLMFWPGISGKFMRYLPVTVFTVLIGSLAYALIFGPALGALFGKAGSRDAKTTASLKELEEGDPTRLQSMTGWYARLLVYATRYAPITLALTAAFIVGTFMLYGAKGSGMVFFNDAEPQYAQITIKSRGNLAAEQVNTLVHEVEERILDVPGILGMNTWTTLSGDTRRGLDRIGQIFIELHPESEREKKGSEILDQIRTNTSTLAGVTVEVQKMEQGPGTGKPIQIEFRSRNRALLEPAVARVREYMDTLDGLRDIDDTRSMPGIEWNIDVDRAQAALFGVDVSQVGMAVQLVTNGLKVAEYRPDNSEEEVDIRVRYPSESRGIGALDTLRISTPQGLVPISSFVTRTPGPKVDTIQRNNGIPVETVRSDIATGVLADTKVKEIKQWIDAQRWDPALTIEFRGANEEQNEAMAFVGVAFLLSLLLMFVLLVTQFNSIYQGLLILLAVSMSTAGVLLGLVVMAKPFSAILTGVGIVALAGIVVNNNIILIDTFNHLRKEHPELDYVSLIVRTGAQRLRPVLLTTVTTVFGLLPMAGNLSIDFVNRSIVYGSQLSMFWVPLSQAIVWGLSIATVLTLIATPALLAIPYQLQRLFTRTAPPPTASADPVEAKAAT